MPPLPADLGQKARTGGTEQAAMQAEGLGTGPGQATPTPHPDSPLGALLAAGVLPLLQRVVAAKEQMKPQEEHPAELQPYGGEGMRLDACLL